MPLTLTVTNAGRAALVNAANTGTAPVTIAQVGLSGTAVTPDATTTALPGEFKRLTTLSGDVVADDTIHLIVRDESADVFTVRSAALYLADGTLFAIYGQAAVLIEKSAQALMLLAIDVRFEDIDAAAITFGDANFLNPPATTEQIGVVELATLAEAIAGTDTSRVPAAKMVKDAVYSWLDARFGANNAGIWHPANDGAGSGLDADLLDGSQASEFAKLASAPSFAGTSVTVAPSTTSAAFNLFGSGFAGAQSYSLRQGISGVSNGGFSIRDETNGVTRIAVGPTGKVGLGIDNAASKFEVWDSIATLVKLQNTAGFGAKLILADQGWASAIGTDNGDLVLYTAGESAERMRIAASGIVTIAGNKVWHAGDDGAGSGLDADLLDGLDSSRFVYGSNTTRTTNISEINSALPSGFYNGFSVPNAPNSDWWHFLNMRHSNENNHFAAQIASNFYSNDFRMRTIDNDVPKAWARLWHDQNDGSGSGLDADMVDGRQAADFALLTGATFTGGLTFAPNVYHNIGGTKFFAGNGGTHNYLISGSSALAIRNQADTATIATLSNTGAFDVVGGFSRNGNQVWDAGNDGAGSGLDADLLDGKQLSDILASGPAVATASLDDATGNAFFAESITGASHSILAFNAGGSVGPVQMRFGYGGILQWRNKTDNVTWQAWRNIWNTANDGSGSGLDADLLDGLQGSAYALLAGATFTGSVNVQNGAVGGVRLISGGAGNTGYVEFNNPAGVRQGYIGFATTGGYITMSAEGAAGWESNKRIRAAAGGGTATLDANGDITADRGNGTGVIYLGPAAGGRYLYSDGSQYHMPGANLAVNGGLAWHSANDGAGSGLDADLLDGYDSSAYNRIVASSLTENGGYRKYADGYIECWGYADIAANTPSQTVNLPVAHTSWVNPSVNGGLAVDTADENYATVSGIVGSPPTGFTVSNSYGGVHRFYWNTRGK